MTAKNFRGQTVAGNIQRENTAKILQRFGDGRRHSVAAMASSLGLKEKFLAEVLDMMFAPISKTRSRASPTAKAGNTRSAARPNDRRGEPGGGRP